MSPEPDPAPDSGPRWSAFDTSRSRAPRQGDEADEEGAAGPGAGRPGLWERLGDGRATAVTAAAAGLVLLGVLLVTSLITDGITFTSDETRPAGENTSIEDPQDDTGAPVESIVPIQPPVVTSPPPSDPSPPPQPGTATPSDDDDDDDDDDDEEDDDDDDDDEEDDDDDD